MFCNKCGFKLNDETAFCPNCGASIEVAGEAAVAESDVQASAPSEQSEIAPKPKKSPKKLVVSLVSVFAIIFVLLAGSVLACKFAPNFTKKFIPKTTNFVQKTFSSGKGYLKYVTADGCMDNSLSSLYAVKGAMTQHGTSEGSLKVVLGDSLKNLVTSDLTDDEKKYIEWINSASVDYTAKSTDAAAQADLTLSLNDTSIISADTIIDMKAPSLYVAFPEILDKYIGINLKDVIDENEFAEIQSSIEELLQAIPDEETLETLLERYISCIVSQIDKVEKESEKVEAGDVSSTQTKLTIKVDEKLIKKVTKAVLTEAKSDNDLKGIIEDICKTSLVNQDPASIYADFIASIDDALENISEAEIDDIDFDIIIWISSEGEISGIGADVDGAEASILTTKKGNKEGLLISGGSASQKIKFEGSAKTSSGKQSGSYKLTAMGMTILNVTTENIDVKKAEAGAFVGKITIEPASKSLKDVLSSFADDDVLEWLDSAKLVLEASDTELKIELFAKNESLISIFASEKFISDDAKIDIPADYIDVSEPSPEVELSEISFDKIIDNLIKANAPAELTDALKLAISENMPQEEPLPSEEDAIDIVTDSLTEEAGTGVALDILNR